MEPEFWQQRWHEGRIGFHQEDVTPLLQQYWDKVGVAAGGQVFVPLAGKSLDLLWLAAHGHRVLGVELSQVAVEQFFAGQRLQPAQRASRYGIHYVAGEIELICGDAFMLDADALANCTGVYDRAALIALPPQMRERYATEIYGCLPTGCSGLLVTLEYPQREKEGPPFSVPGDEVRALYARDWTIGELARRDILAEQPRFLADGVTSLQTVAWRMQRR
jgi:thiopurine S-methyltransferase